MSGIFKEVRAFFNWAYKNKIIDTFPFEGFEMPSERYGSPIYLTLDDVQKIYAADLSDTPKENARTVVVPLNSVAQEIVDRYADYPGDKLLPFESSERFSDNIKIIFEKAITTVP